MKLEVNLGASSEASFEILLNSNPFVFKWLDEVSWCIQNCSFNQQEAFASFITLDQAIVNLTNACHVINRYLKGFLDIRSDIRDQSQEYFNYLHEKFEQLSGEFEKPTKLFLIANDELKTAIRDLNFYIHRVETKLETGNLFYISFNKDQYRRSTMQQEDYQYAEYDIPAGSLFVHYSELGKDYYDLFKDGLTIGYQGNKNLHNYSGEASLALEDLTMLGNNRYKIWLQEQGIDPYNKFLGHGKIILGKVSNLPDVVYKLKTHQCLHSILIKD